MIIVGAALCAGLAAALLPRPRARWPDRAAMVGRVARSGSGPRRRVLYSALAGLAGPTFFPPPLGWLVGLGLSWTVWVAVGRTEPADVRRAREQVRRDLPHVVQLLGLALDSGSSVPEALRQLTLALPGPATDSLRLAESRLALGVEPAQVWGEIALQPGLAPLGRVLARAGSSGAGVADLVRRLGDDLAREARHEVEDRARSVGIKAALPLGLCLLPGFLLIGIVPVVVGALQAIQW